jgi:hypothetical protein
MKRQRISVYVSFILIVTASACVDRLYIDFEESPNYPIAIYGFISDQPGPYQIQVNRTFDVEAKTSLRIPISVKSIVLSDNVGNEEILNEVNEGVYETSADGMRGVVGNAYKIKAELLDGRVYESIPDTLYAGGAIDSLYYNFFEEKTQSEASQYGFDVFVNSSSANSLHGRFLWQFTGTYKALTHPENNHKICEYYRGKCNYVPLCSGLINVGEGVRLIDARWERVKPCECCTCWYSFNNTAPVLSDNIYNPSGMYPDVKIQHVPLSPWVFMYKLHVKASMLSLSPNSFRFWKAIKVQQDAVYSLFQPVSGRIPTNFVQIGGSSTPVYGVFFSTSIVTRSMYITPEAIPHFAVWVIRPQTPPQWNDTCVSLFPNATTTQPEFWVE